uniref:Uncharacterized protein n=1 Tax=Noctiluca scintillans TaxID=2966 RepID=A0A7S1AD89_NOCSC
MPGDRQFQKNLEGRQLMQWYFPSKFNFQDFRVEEYFEMQDDRFAPREQHRCMPLLRQTLQEVSRHRDSLRQLFRDMEEETFVRNPTLQDLYGLFSLVDPDPVLSFPVPEQIVTEHRRNLSWFFRNEGDDELMNLWLLLPEDVSKALEGEVMRLQSEPEVRAFILDQIQRRNLFLPLDQVVMDSAEGAPALTYDRALERPSVGRTFKKKMSSSTSKRLRDYMSIRHRFVDPMYRRRRLKWLERLNSGKHKERELKYNPYYMKHADEHKEWPTNKGSVTVLWPSPHH